MGVAGPASAGENIHYDGTNPGMLQTDPRGNTGSLFPGTTANPLGTGNSVTVTGGTIPRGVYGGLAPTENSSGNAKSGDANWNTVTISGGSVGYVYGGYSRADSTSSNSTSGEATHNTVTISSGTMKDSVWGGSSTAVSNNGSATSRAATWNTVSISGGTVKGSVWGGASSASSISATSGDASHNTVSISGGTVDKDIIGGYSRANSGGGSATSGDATYNTVTLAGNPTFDANTRLYGGVSLVNNSPSASDQRTGNTLNILTSGITVLSIENFQHYRFALLPNGATGLTLTDATGDTDMGGSLTPTPSVPIALPGAALKVGETATLLAKTGTGPLTNVPTLNAGTAQQGVALAYGYTLTKSPDDKSITATVTSAGIANASRSPAAIRRAGTGMLNQAGDFAAGEGMGAALAAARQGNTGISTGSATPGGNVFALIKGGDLRFKTGEGKTGVDGVSVMAGAAKNFTTGTGTLMGGGFFETGWHNYDSQADGINADGDSRYYGVGGLLRHEAEADKGFYAEDSARIGRIENTYAHQSTFINAHNSSTSNYYGIHAGLGYIQPVSQGSVDVYGKSLWTHLQGKDMNIAGDTFNFEAVNSLRVQVGGRFNITTNSHYTPYVGAAYEYEFSNKAKGSVYGYQIDAPSLKGSTGIFEAGVKMNPVANNKGFSVDIGLQGYVGQREGILGSLLLKQNF